MIVEDVIQSSNNTTHRWLSLTFESVIKCKIMQIITKTIHMCVCDCIDILI